MDNLSRWSLKSLTIGPQVHQTNTEFWEEAFKDLQPLPRVGNVMIICNYPSAKAFNTDCWEYFDRLLVRQDLFPALKVVDVQSSLRSQQLNAQRWFAIYTSLRAISMRGLGPRRPFAIRGSLPNRIARKACRAYVPRACSPHIQSRPQN